MSVTRCSSSRARSRISFDGCGSFVKWNFRPVRPSAAAPTEVMTHTRTALALLLLLPLGACSPHVNLNTPSDRRPPNGYELFYTAIAADFGEPGLCEKIAGRAVDESDPGMLPGIRGWDVSFQKSACHFYTAVKAHKEAWCEPIRSVMTIPANQSNISKSECRQVIRDKGNYGYSPSPFGNLDEMMKEMGYSDEDRFEGQYSLNPYNNAVYQFYASVRETAAFRARVRDLPNYAEAFAPDRLRPATEDEVLTQLLAVDDSSAELCQKISPNSVAEGWYGSDRASTLKMALRNACLASVAAKTGQAAWCAKIIPLEGIYSLSTEDCRTSVANQARHEGPWEASVNFSTMASFVHVLQKLGYSKPFLDSPPDQMGWSDYYIYYLSHRADAAVKRRFVERVAALPSFSK